MARLIFASTAIRTAFASMADGMEENHCDDDDQAVYEGLRRIGTALLQDDGLLEVPIAESDYGTACMVLAGCLDNSSGLSREDDPDCDYYVFAEEVRVIPERIGGYAEDLPLKEALQVAIAALSDAEPDSPRAQAHDWLVEIFEQRGCEVHEPGCDSLVDLCAVIIRG